jgi:YidC/Oxa1 family membrane protein insertase
MFNFFANLFGYVLNFLYNFFNNYGIAIILFTILVKLAMLPLSIKQQKTMKKSAKLQEKVKVLQFKYKNDPEKMNQEMMNLYKSENMSPFSGCLSTIIQLVLLLSIFYLVRSPLTFMKKVDADTINNYVSTIKEEGKTVSQNYPEIDIIREKGQQDEKVYINTEFLGLDLSEIPQQDMLNYKVWVIPVLYIISSFISIKLTTKMQENKKKKDNNIIDVTDETSENSENKEEKNELDSVMQANKTMSWMMPILSISIAIIAPLGLALYWLVNNLLMIGERIILDKVIKTEEE